jgi:hypothetical protein
VTLATTADGPSIMHRWSERELGGRTAAIERAAHHTILAGLDIVPR